jgi:gas vesicle protein
MEYDDDARAFNFVSGMIFGAAIGVGVALLFAPDSGRRTRRRISRLAGDVKDDAVDRWQDLSDDVKDKVDEAFQGAQKRFKS